MTKLKKTYLLGSILSFAIVAFFTMRGHVLDLSVVGVANQSDEIGRQAPELIRALKNDLNLNFHPLNKIKKQKGTKRIKKYIAKSSKDWGKVVIFEDVLWDPKRGDHTKKMDQCPDDRLKIACSMTESTHLPGEWTEILNTKFDAVITPSEFLIKVYLDSGVKIPIFYLPLGLNLKKYLQQPLKKERNKTMVFGNFSDAVDRKNQLALIRSFHQAFGNDPTVKLVIYAYSSDTNIRNAITKLLSEINVDNIEFLQIKIDKQKYLEKLKKIDCYVSPSKGEGFSFQSREAMALGIPVIATNNTAQKELCRSGFVASVESTSLEIAIDSWGDYYGKNFNCSEADLVDALIEMRENYDRHLAQADDRRKWAMQFDYQNLKELYKGLIRPQKICLGKENMITTSSITTSSVQLYNKLCFAFGDKNCEICEWVD